MRQMLARGAAAQWVWRGIDTEGKACYFYWVTAATPVKSSCLACRLQLLRWVTLKICNNFWNNTCLISHKDRQKQAPYF